MRTQSGKLIWRGQAQKLQAFAEVHVLAKYFLPPHSYRPSLLRSQPALRSMRRPATVQADIFNELRWTDQSTDELICLHWHSLGLLKLPLVSRGLVTCNMIHEPVN